MLIEYNVIECHGTCHNDCSLYLFLNLAPYSLVLPEAEGWSYLRQGQ